jgi:hypothetical protein
MNFTNKTFTDEQINLDGNVFESCTFVRCHFIYEGGISGLSGNQLIEPRFSFSGAAANTLKFMAGLYLGGGRDLIEATINNIRKGDVGDDDVINAGFIE